MAIPVTQGKLQTSISSMALGDYIAARYTTTAMTSNGNFSEIGTVDTSTVQPFSSTNLDGYVYLIKIAKGVLMPNCRLYSSITYAALNIDNRIYGKKVTIGGKDFLLRVPKINEAIAACGTLNGALDITDRTANFGVTMSTADAEIIQENYNLTQGLFQWAWSPATISNAGANANASPARLVLEYSDDIKCTDLYH